MKINKAARARFLRSKSQHLSPKILLASDSLAKSPIAAAIMKLTPSKNLTPHDITTAAAAAAAISQKPPVQSRQC
jgi:hypothetical protein